MHRRAAFEQREFDARRAAIDRQYACRCHRRFAHPAVTSSASMLHFSLVAPRTARLPPVVHGSVSSHRLMESLCIGTERRPIPSSEGSIPRNGLDEEMVHHDLCLLTTSNVPSQQGTRWLQSYNFCVTPQTVDA